MSSDYEGLQSEIRNLETPKIEVFENEYSNRNYEINLICGDGELTSICPKTGLPDFAKLEIRYHPEEYCLELKSFKEYLLFYRDVGIFHENLTNKIADDIAEACKPSVVDVKITMNPRGNIKTVVEARRFGEVKLGKIKDTHSQEEVYV